jgi:hypothetical protein
VADAQFLSQLVFSWQWIAVCQETAFDTVDELVDYPLLFVESNLFDHAESNSSAIEVRQYSQPGISHKGWL